MWPVRDAHHGGAPAHGQCRPATEAILDAGRELDKLLQRDGAASFPQRIHEGVGRGRNDLTDHAWCHPHGSPTVAGQVRCEAFIDWARYAGPAAMNVNPLFSEDPRWSAIRTVKPPAVSAAPETTANEPACVQVATTAGTSE